MKRYAQVLESPVGALLIVVDGTGALVSIEFCDDRGCAGRIERLQLEGALVECPSARCNAAVEQLGEYFRGERREFTLPLAPSGTAFQKRVWSELCKIPYGSTISYRELAERIGQPTATRAVGAANGQNPISIVVPCHRVIGANGSLTGYGGGPPRKQALLELEGWKAGR